MLKKVLILLFTSIITFTFTACSDKNMNLLSKEQKIKNNYDEDILEIISDFKNDKNLIQINEKVELEDFRIISLYKVEKQNMTGIKHKIINITYKYDLKQIEESMKRMNNVIAITRDETNQIIYAIYKK